MLEPAIDIVHLYHTNPEDQDDDDESTTPTSKPFNQVQTLELFARSMLISSRSILTTDAVYSTRKLRHGNAQFIPLLLSAKRKLPLHPKIRPQICIVLPRQPVILVATSPEYIPTLLDALSMSNCEANGDRTLVQEPYPKENLAFLEQAGIRFFQFPIPGNKEPFVVIPDVSIIGALETILDKRNHPILVHCNAGKVLPRIPIKPPDIDIPTSQLNLSPFPHTNSV